MNGEMGGLWFVACDIGGPPCNMHLSFQNGRTPLIEASSGGHVECVKLLLDRGARTNDQDKVCTVLMRLVLNEMITCVMRVVCASAESWMC